MTKRKKTEPVVPTALSAAELLVIQMLRAGAPMPPVEALAPIAAPAPAAAPVQIQIRRAKAVDPIWKTTPKVCPKCGQNKLVVPDFGVIVRRGVENPQGWCKECRSRTNYHVRERLIDRKRREGSDLGPAMRRVR